MLFVVELTIVESNILDRMNEMRTWLDHHRIEPTMFRLVEGKAPGEIRVNFSSQADAADFAARFGGNVSPVASIAADAAQLNLRSASSSGSGRARPN